NPEDSVASRARFQSDACLITAPKATSPSSSPCRLNFSTSAPSVFTAMPKLPMSAYAVLLRQNGMRTPPRIATRCVELMKGFPVSARWMVILGRVHRRRIVSAGKNRRRLAPDLPRCGLFVQPRIQVRRITAHDFFGREPRWQCFDAQMAPPAVEIQTETENRGRRTGALREREQALRKMRARAEQRHCRGALVALRRELAH